MKISNEVNHLIIVRGHPGSGKTTFAKKFAELGYKHFENDSFFVDENGVYTFDFQFHQQAKDVCIQNTIDALKAGDWVVVSNTYTKIKEMDEIINFAESAGIPYRIFEMNHNYENVHNVPAEVVEDKKRNFESHPEATVIDSDKTCYII